MAGGDRFRKHLEIELHHRQQTRSRYSLRVFARELSVDYSFLSKLMNGSRSFTPLTLRRLGPKLGLSYEETDLYLEDILQK